MPSAHLDTGKEDLIPDGETKWKTSKASLVSKQRKREKKIRLNYCMTVNNTSKWATLFLTLALQRLVFPKVPLSAQHFYSFH